MITNELKQAIQENKTTESEYIAYLEENKYFPEENEVNNYLKQIEDSNNEVLEFTILTHGDCNFRCKYCYEHFKNIGMSHETENAILKFAEKKLSSGNYRFFCIAWFGGEPLLGYKTIQRLSLEFLELCKRFKIIYSSSITTRCGLERILQKMVVKKNEKKALISNFIDGERNGRYEVFYQNGNLRIRGNFKNDFEEGIWKKFYKDANIFSKYNMEHGKETGIKKIYYKKYKKL